MIEGPTIGDWTQYGWIPDEVSSFPARVRLRDAAWMVYYEANVGDERERAEMLELRERNAKLRELALDLYRCSDPCNDCPHYNGSNDGFYCDLGIGWKARRMRELGIEVE